MAKRKSPVGWDGVEWCSIVLRCHRCGKNERKQMRALGTWKGCHQTELPTCIVCPYVRMQMCRQYVRVQNVCGWGVHVLGQ